MARRQRRDREGFEARLACKPHLLLLLLQFLTSAAVRVQFVAFRDEEQLEHTERPSGRRSGGERQRQYFLRRLIALGVGVLIVILAVLGIRGCLDARKERAFENYLRDLSSVAGDSRQLSDGFFERLNNPPPDLTELDLQNQIRSDRGSAEGHLQRAEGMDPPDQLNEAHAELALSFELRRDALETIAERIPDAFADEGRQDAVEAITRQMQILVASDALYARARQEIRGVLNEEEIEGNVPASRFVPDPVERYLNDLELSALLAAVAVEPGETAQVRGVEILSTTVNPGGVVLLPETPNTVALNRRAQLEVAVQNSGEVREQEVTVRFSLSGAPEAIEGSSTIQRINPAASQTTALPLQPTPPTETELTLTVTVLPVPGETLIENNQSTYPVTFE
jgi:hypothetical protein